MKKEKIVIAIAAGVAILTFVIVTVLSKPNIKPTPQSENGVSYIMNADGSFGLAGAEEKAITNDSVLSRTDAETKEVEYSEDGGQTWTKNVPSEIAK